MIETTTSHLPGRESTAATIRRKGSPYLATRTLGALTGGSQMVFGSPSPRLIDSSINDAAPPIQRFRVPWNPPAPKTAGDVYELREKFDGVVLSVGQDNFEARLFPSEASDEPVETEFSKDDLSIEDRALLEPGTMFVLTIGYRTSGSSRRRESYFYLRRMPAMTDEQVSQASVRASQYRDELQWK
jgi:hypothetical protein